MEFSFQQTAEKKIIKLDHTGRPPIIHLSLSARPPGFPQYNAYIKNVIVSMIAQRPLIQNSFQNLDLRVLTELVTLRLTTMGSLGLCHRKPRSVDMELTLANDSFAYLLSA
jgi:hypothetical protein